eukprot:TRINITY_DN3025_c0_g2_i1.p1 TRINITY_DN3025_c0_g2~~TRINITY_DN3025_c0_g2_i1.p1  ORF type:complete len:443 (-),score=160.98 TRINITY_DN3025_c0_g2_i1:654-1982(-)
MAVAVSPSPSSPTPGLLPSDQRDHEKFCRHFFQKCAQIIVQSRLGEKAFFNSQPHSYSWFNLAMKDIPEIALETKKAYTGGSLGCHTIEISLKTSEGDSMILETWSVSMTNETRDPHSKLNNWSYNHLSLLLKSVLCISRVTPAYKFSRRQGPESFVVCYRIHAGEPVSHSLLGKGYMTCSIGTVSSPVGSVSIKVDYRTDMTISPSNVLVSSSSSSVSNVMLLKSDESHANKKSNKSSDESSAALTSDESQEAYRLFTSDSPQCPPLPAASTTDEEEEVSNARSHPEAFKFGAFATSPKNYSLLLREDEKDDDPLFNFLPQEEDELPRNKTSQIEEEEEEELDVATKDPQSLEQGFEIFDNVFERPESRSNAHNPATAVPNKSEFGIFFKEKPDISLGLDPEDKPLEDIEAQILGFEKSMDVYNDMIKALDTLTSESEQEG